MSGITLTRRVLLAQVALLALAGASLAQEADRVLSIGGSVTEIVHALGQEHRLVARDTTSTFPPKVTELPDVGYARALSPEGVLSVAPSLILAIEGAGPPDTIEVLAQSGVTFVSIPEAQSADGILAKITAVGAALGVPDRAEALATETRAALDTAAARTSEVPEAARKRVLFILSLQGGRILASGRDTQAAAIIEMAGGINAVTGFDGYKQMTDEAVAEAAPDVILMMDRTGDHAILDEQLFGLPAIRTTPAGAHDSIVRMNGLYLLGFGPRTAGAALDLNRALYGTARAAHDDRDPS
ncbi:MAG: ABC transporter substrate-binding protein [Roseovarius sp.]|uniref:heme/hemin ABC transporter substrate-binding protein n=1 Tax=Roseovarius sp. TaxID=1486281 RepID=UPI001B725659|nr:ABC transporter substrate-binding protein [Roseovarius sp.]MBQ0751677.1 ABC transporter substrate-binding protein [Roseovarius sp.]MBQ0809766.1 ABC transporter substrate-binding protein [Roseovarius sp.]